MRKNKRNTLLTVLLMTLVVAGCSSNVDEEPFAPRAAVFSAELTTLSTRSADEANEWSAYTTGIGISATNQGSGYTNRQYTTEATTGEATFVPVSGTYYFQSTKATESFTAYAPYAENAENGVISFTEPQDYIWAETQELSYDNPSASLSFKHVMAQLKLTLNIDMESLGTIAISGIELSNVILSGEFDIMTGAITAGKVSSDSYDVSENVVNSAPFILVPQPAGVVVTITLANSTTYQAELPELEAGKSYEYSLNVKNNSLSIAPTIKDWEKETSTVNAKKAIAQGEVFTDVESVKLYDLALSDGSFMRVTNDKGELPSSIDLQGYTAYGIVFYTGNTDDEYLNNSGYTHGLIVSLKDGNDGNTCEWIKFTDGSTQINTSSDPENERNGYYNTLRLTLFNMDQSNVDILLRNSIIINEKLEEFIISQGYNRKYSTWYIPSNAELRSLSSGREVINNLLHLIGGTSISDNSYWTCTEESYQLVYIVNMSNNSSETTSKLSKYYSRFICAF